MRTFLDENFLLPNPAAERLFHEYAKMEPIFDYHSHLPVKQIEDDVNFENLTQVWLYGDHYKWRAMRACGMPERLVSGIPRAASDYERFAAWAEVMPQTIGNPLYHWSHLELKRYFGVNELLSPATAPKIYSHCSEKLKRREFSVRSIIERSNVSVVCTTDDPTDGLASHVALSETDWGCRAYPAWRPDKALTGNDPAALNAWLDKLEAASDHAVSSYFDLLEALEKRHRFFESRGCKLSDYGIERPYAAPYADSAVEISFRKLRSGEALLGDELEQYRSSLLYEMLKMDARADWTQQLHFGAKRNNNSCAFKLQGPDTGYDAMGRFAIGDALVTLLDRLDSEDSLARTIVYVLNPSDSDMIASIIGSFMDGRAPGKIQFGAAWWFNDHKDGINRHLMALSNICLLSRFVGMFTDSRCFLSYPRHEYFRRLLCAKLGTEMEAGELPDDFQLIGVVVKDICFGNAVRYFGMELLEKARRL
ncbi:MAG: glucuronate isomerase [Synergistaceae bacterium]|jgi:glucuronate isomerase|nr:glucuronate isomerase [Synergistaceae bacterium]